MANRFHNSSCILYIFAFLGIQLLVAVSNLQAQPFYQNKNDIAQRTAGDPILTKEYYVDKGSKINIFTHSGNIEVISVRNSRKVRIALYAERGFSFWPTGNSLDDYRIINLKRGNEIISSVEHKSKHKSSFWSSQTTFSYKIEVPESISTNLKTLNGNVSIQDLIGKQILKASSGNISLENIEGYVEAYSSAGNIEINESEGRIFARADGGNINISDTKGEIRLKIHGGKIVSSGITGSMVAVVNAGDINASFDRVGEVINLQANAGNINLVVPRTAGYGLTARGSSVSLDRNGIFEGTYSQRMAEGSINGGGIPVYLTAIAGTVTFELKNKGQK